MEFGYRTTALEVVEGKDLSGRTAVVTGGNSGIGTETVRAFASAGANVIFSSRNLEAGQAVAKELRGTGLKGDIRVAQLDLADLQSVEAFARLLLKEAHINYLILNAGVMACPYGLTKDGFEMQMGTNVHGHFHLVLLLEEALKAQAEPSRVVFLSSEAHRFGHVDPQDLHYKHGRWYFAFPAYGQSKLADILIAKEFAHRWEGSNVTALSLHPGSIATNLMRHNILLRVGAFLAGSFLKSAAAGAATSVYAAIAPELEDQAGAYLKDCKVSQPTQVAENLELAHELFGVVEQEIAAALAKLPDHRQET